MEEREPKRGLDRRGTQLALHAGENRREPDELPIRVQPQDCVDQPISPVGHREALPQPHPDVVRADVARRSVHVHGAGLDRLVLGPVLLIAAQLAAVVHAGRLLALPFDLLDRERAAARAAAGREQVGDEHAQARVAVGRRPEGRECGIEVAQVGRPEHHLGEQAGQRPGLEAEAATLPIDRRPGDPAAASVQVGDDVARRGVRLEPGVDEVGRGRRREPFVGGQGEPGFRP